MPVPIVLLGPVALCVGVAGLGCFFGSKIVFVVGFEVFDMVFVGEFDPGSGRTLAACLTHASRAERPFGVLERRTGE